MGGAVVTTPTSTPAPAVASATSPGAASLLMLLVLVVLARLTGLLVMGTSVPTTAAATGTCPGFLHFLPTALVARLGVRCAAAATAPLLTPPVLALLALLASPTKGLTANRAERGVPQAGISLVGFLGCDNLVKVVREGFQLPAEQ